jgi:hypothetical protein
MVFKRLSKALEKYFLLKIQKAGISLLQKISDKLDRFLEKHVTIIYSILVLILLIVLLNCLTMMWMVYQLTKTPLLFALLFVGFTSVCLYIKQSIHIVLKNTKQFLMQILVNYITVYSDEELNGIDKMVVSYDLEMSSSVDNEFVIVHNHLDKENDGFYIVSPTA